jgi:hypothetical protein
LYAQTRSHDAQALITPQLSFADKRWQPHRMATAPPMKSSRARSAASSANPMKTMSRVHPCSPLHGPHTLTCRAEPVKAVITEKKKPASSPASSNKPAKVAPIFAQAVNGKGKAAATIKEADEDVDGKAAASSDSDVGSEDDGAAEEAEDSKAAVQMCVSAPPMSHSYREVEQGRDLPAQADRVQQGS